MAMASDREREIVGLKDDARITSFGLLMEANSQLTRRFDRSLHDNCDIGIAWFEVLLRLGRSPDNRLTMSELARQLAITSGGATRLVDRVEAAGYIERCACPEDRRVQWVGLTESGRDKLAESYAQHVADLEEEFFGRLTPAEVSQLDRIMSKLRRPT